jgi:hypothetical protein
VICAVEAHPQTPHTGSWAVRPQSEILSFGRAEQDALL